MATIRIKLEFEDRGEQLDREMYWGISNLWKELAGKELGRNVTPRPLSIQVERIDLDEMAERFGRLVDDLEGSRK